MGATRVNSVLMPGPGQRLPERGSCHSARSFPLRAPVAFLALSTEAAHASQRVYRACSTGAPAPKQWPMMPATCWTSQGWEEGSKGYLREARPQGLPWGARRRPAPGLGGSASIRGPWGREFCCYWPTDPWCRGKRLCILSRKCLLCKELLGQPQDPGPASLCPAHRVPFSSQPE